MAGLRDQIERLRVVNALRIALVMVLCVLLAVALDMQTGVFVIFPALVISFMLHDESPMAGLSLIVGTAIGAVISFVTIDFLLTARPVFMAFTLLAVFVLGYWAAQAFRGRWPWGYGALLAILVVSGAAFAALGGAELGERLALNWTLETVLGVGVAWLVMLGIWPSPKAHDLTLICDGIAQECAKLLTVNANRVANDHRLSYHPSPVSLMNFGKWLAQVDRLKWRFGDDRLEHGAIRQRMRNLLLSYVNIRHMERTLQDLPQDKSLAELRAAIASVMRDLAAALQGQGDPDGIAPSMMLIDREQRIRASNIDEPRSDFRRLSAKLAAFSAAANELQRDIKAMSDPTMSDARIPGEFQPDGHVRQIAADSARAALKLSIGVAVALSLHLFAPVPAGAYLVLGLVIVMVQPNLGKSHLRVRLWFPGVIAGSLYSIAGLVLISYAPHFPLLLAWLALGFLIGAYVGTGHDRISYSGFQICIGITVILGMAAFPVASIVMAEERVLGAILGFGVALIIGQLLWPEHPADLLRKSFADYLRAMPPALERICAADNPEASLLKTHILRLKMDVERDFALLYDFSYMLPGKIASPYDFHGITHATGNMFHQLFTLHQVLLRIDDAEIRRAMVEPCAQVLEKVQALSESLAEQIDAGVRPQFGLLRVRLDELDTAIAAQEAKQIDSEQMRTAWCFGINFIREMRHQLALVVTSLEGSSGEIAPRTSNLTQTYEGAR